MGAVEASGAGSSLLSGLTVTSVTSLFALQTHAGEGGGLGLEIIGIQAAADAR